MKSKKKNIFRKTVNRLQPRQNGNAEQKAHGLGIDYTVKKYTDDQYSEGLKNIPEVGPDTIKSNKTNDQTIYKDNQNVYFIDKAEKKCLIVSITEKHIKSGFIIEKIKFLSDRVYIFLEAFKEEQAVRYAFDLTTVVGYSALKDEFVIV